MMHKKTPSIRLGEYLERGDYHRDLNPQWSYYPIYVRKMAWVECFIHEQVSKDWLILDAGCGEGIFVEKLSGEGYKIFGIDRNYGSRFVHRGDLCQLPYATATFDLLFCLDVIEHLDLLTQEEVLHEMVRILKPMGKAVFAIPNLAHLESRWSFLRQGKLIRTSNIKKHPGDRPIVEYLNMMARAGFKVINRIGIKMTLPKGIKSFLSRKLSERLMYWSGAPASLCFLNILICEKKKD